VAGDGEGGEYDGEVGLDCLALVADDTGRAFRSDLVMRKDASTCQRSWWAPITVP
jgi:hypothetical protein